MIPRNAAMAELMESFKVLVPDPDLFLENYIQDLRGLLKNLDDRRYPKKISIRGQFVTIRWILTRFIKLKENIQISNAYTCAEEDELYKILKKHKVITDEWEYPELAKEAAMAMNSTRKRTESLVQQVASVHQAD